MREPNLIPPRTPAQEQALANRRKLLAAHGGLWSYADISRMTGITVGALRKRLATGTMPVPDMRFGSSPVWKPETIIPWMMTAQPGTDPTAE